ncbi:MAG: hydrogenase maturation nickel metallochaperone HypA [Phycisphaerae bacterium]|nr:hydrogenase maturation nickel metallochaperone HypA [Phycisphaerae bacterium]
MHEMSVATGIINVLDDKLGQLAPCKLIALELAVGKLSGIEEHSLRFALDTLLVGQGHTDVHLRCRQSPAVFKCTACNWQGEMDGFTLACPECNGPDLDIIAGQDVTLETIEVE